MSSSSELSDFSMSDYDAHARAWLNSDEPQKDYCARHGLTYSRFVSARSRLLSSEGKTRTRNAFVPVAIHSSMPSSDEQDLASGLVESLCIQRPNGEQISLTGRFSVLSLPSLIPLLLRK